MNLLELCYAGAVSEPSGSVPGWMLGCFRRAAITFATGQTDHSTLVIWLQSPSLTGDLRLAADRPKLATRAELYDAPREVLARLAEVEGGISACRFVPDAQASSERLAGELTWLSWDAFQAHSKWPEPGTLRRVGDCLMEFAPSGAYVEDWRLQPSGDGPLIGLRLLAETDGESGALRHRGGGLLICGCHVLFVRGRAHELPTCQRLSELLIERSPDRNLLDQIFGFEASYARLEGASPPIVQASTLPWREAEPLLSLDGFALQTDGTLLQRTHEAGHLIERRFSIDTLQPAFVASVATRASAEGAAWLEREAATLLRG
jgi:hypothetical protein